MTAIGVEDIATMRAQGDLTEFLLSLAGRARKTVTVPTPEPEIELPRSRPGAWPDAIRPPEPVTPATPAESTRALEEYRAWLQADCPPADIACECGGCRPAGSSR